MGHYDVGEWADFVRNLVTGARRSEMTQHLTSGCAECNANVAFLRQVAGAAETDRSYESPSAGLAEAARRVFPGAKDRREHAGWMPALEALIARLTFDSAAQLHPAGARGDRPASRQLMYQAGDYWVDLRLDRARNSMRVILVGQVANQKDPLLQMARLPVFVMAGRKIVSETASNEFGEFSLEFLPRQDLRLCVQVTQAGVQLEVPLKRSLEEHET